MELVTCYSKRIVSSTHKKAFEATAQKYREAVDFFIDVALPLARILSCMRFQTAKVNLIEYLTVKTKDNPDVPYDFSEKFYKFPSYYRRAAISEALGKVSSYWSNLNNWIESGRKGKMPGKPTAGYIYPALYKQQCYESTGLYSARVKVYIRNTWDWIDIPLRKSDADYIKRHCSNRTECAPTLQKRGKVWSLDFAYKETVELIDTPVKEQIVLAVDLGINSACTCCAMKSDGTIIGRRFLHLPVEEDSLKHAFNRIRKAQRNGAKSTPRLWAYAKGINDHIATKTAQFIIETAEKFNADVIVFEHLDLGKKKRGKGKQRLHHWRAKYVQAMVTLRAHCLGMHVSHVCAWNTSRLAFDGSGRTERGEKANLDSYSVCRFSTGKVYNCDLNASYNIGARYFIRELLKPLRKTERLGIEAKVPQCSKRSTCTLSTLISLNAALAA